MHNSECTITRHSSRFKVSDYRKMSTLDPYMFYQVQSGLEDAWCLALAIRWQQSLKVWGPPKRQTPRV